MNPPPLTSPPSRFSPRLCNFQKFLLQPVDGSSLGLFRFLFGLILIVQTFFIFTPEFVENNFIRAYYHFPYSLFEALHLKRLPPTAMQVLFFLMALASIGILSGLCFRLSSLTFFLTFSYVFLFEKSLYADHHYLFVLVSFLFLFMDAHRWPALNILRLRKIPLSTVAHWQILILRIQFILVYFYSALSKIDSDWLLKAQPLKRILAEKTLFGLALNQEWAAYLFSYAGFILVAAIAPLLAFNRFRRLTFLCILIFNLSNHWLFNDIGVFPFLMIASFALFVEPDAPRKWIENIQRWRELRSPRLFEPSPTIGTPSIAKACHPHLVTGFFFIYVLIQVLVPLRHFLYPGHPSWTFEGNRFSWRLKINTKLVQMKILCTDPTSGRSFDITQGGLLTESQRWLDNMPDMLLQYVHYLKKELETAGIKNPVMTVHAFASYNGRPYQRYIDANINLAEVDYPLFSHATWVVPLRK